MADKKKAMEAVKAAASLLEVETGLQETLALADAMGLIKVQKQRKVSAFLQQGVDPDAAEYEYKSGDIVELLESLNKDFKEEKTTLDAEYGKTEKACTDLIKSLKGKLETNAAEYGKTEKACTDLIK